MLACDRTIHIDKVVHAMEPSTVDTTRRKFDITWIEEVSEIDGDDYDGEWFVSFNRGRFRMSCNRSATSLVHALMRGKPTIALSGYTLPEL